MRRSLHDDTRTGMPNVFVSARRRGDAQPIMIVGGELVLPDIVAWVDEKDASAAWARARIQHGIVDA